MAQQMYKFTVTDIYRSVHILKIYYTSSAKDAMKQLGSTPSRWKIASNQYPAANVKYHDVRGMITFGKLLERPELVNNEMTIPELYAIIDKFVDEEYQHLEVTGHTAV